MGRSRALIESCRVSLRLWPVAMMSSFSGSAQRVNGCWDYAMACQTPFSSPAPPTPTPFQIGRSQIRHSCTFFFWFRDISMLLAQAAVGGKKKTGVWFHCKGESFPLLPPPPLHMGLAPALQGENCRQDLQLPGWAISAECQTSKKHLYLPFLKANMKPRLSLIASKWSCSGRLDAAEVKDGEQMSSTARDKQENNGTSAAGEKRSRTSKVCWSARSLNWSDCEEWSAS